MDGVNGHQGHASLLKKLRKMPTYILTRIISNHTGILDESFVASLRAEVAGRCGRKATFSQGPGMLGRLASAQTTRLQKALEVQERKLQEGRLNPKRTNLATLVAAILRDEVTMRSRVEGLEPRTRRGKHGAAPMPEEELPDILMCARGPTWDRARFEEMATAIIEGDSFISRECARPAVVTQLASEVPALLRGLLADSAWLRSLEAYGLPNGFAAVRVIEVNGCALRLHFFNQRADVEGLHSHKWCFESAILAGRLISEEWRKSTPGETPELVTGCFVRAKKEGSALDAELRCLSTSVGMMFDNHLVHKAGQVYFLGDNTIHRVMRSRVMTSTLVLTHPKSASAYIYDLADQHPDAVRAAGEPVQRSSRLLDEDEVRGHFVELLQRLEPAGAPPSVQDWEGAGGDSGAEEEESEEMHVD